MIKSSIRKMCRDIIKEELQKIIYGEFDMNSKLDLVQKYDTSEMNIWKAISIFSITEIRFNITYESMGDTNTEFFEFGDFCEFREFMHDFIPKYEHFTGCQLGVYYTHPHFGKQDVWEVFVNSHYRKSYPTNELRKVFDKINEFLKNKPELLI